MTNTGRLLSSIVGASIFAWSGASHAQGVTESEGEATVAEVVVTAQKRSSSVQDVPFSVAATSEEQIRGTGANNIVDLARNVAGLSIADLGPGQSQMAIRGISSGQVIRDQPGVKEQVGVYLDESPISVALFTPDLELFDLDRLEVLRGPQGTLFGAGSESGTLRYITRQPVLGRFEGSAETAAEAVAHGDIGGTLRGALNLPLSETAAARVTGYYHRLPGFIDALQPGGDLRHDVNDGYRTGGRVAVLFRPNERLSITPRLMYQRLNTDGYPRVDLFNMLANPFTTSEPPVAIGHREQFTQRSEGLNDRFKLGDVALDYDLGPTTLSSVSSYIDRKILVLRDATQLTGSVTYDIGGSPAEVRLTAPLYDRTSLSAFSQELRLGSNGKGNVDWLLGAFYQKQHRRYSQALPVEGYDAVTQRLFGVVSADFAAPPDTPVDNSQRYRLRQYALFGEATWHFDDRWSVTGGLRYYNFDERRVLDFTGFFSAPISLEVPGSTDSNGWSPRAILSFKATDDMQFNLQAARGFRLGGINDPLNIGLCSPQDVEVFGNQKTWKDEKTWNYEVGAKMRLLDRKATFNLAAFYADIRDLQATTTAGTCSSRIVFNVPKARSAGVEAELFVRPNGVWDFGISATYVDASLRSSVVSTLSDGTTAVVGGLETGNRLPTAPKLQAVGATGITLPAGAGRDFFANVTVQYIGSSFSQFENEVDNFGLIGANVPGAARLIGFGDVPPGTVIAFDTRLPDYVLASLRVGLRTDRFEVAAYVNNLTNETARLALDYERGRSARVGYLTNQPRTLGLSARWSF